MTWSSRDVAAVLRRPGPGDDKYTRGVLGVRTGSERYPGAAVLGVEAAWRTGIGMVRYTGTARDFVLARRPETVAAEGRVQAWLVGSGTDAASRTAEETSALTGILSGDAPVVVDAGALDLAPAASAPVVVTPHARELVRLRAALGLDDADGPAAAIEAAQALGGVVLLKGAETVVCAPDGQAIVVRVDVPWLATAGTGDVLGGVLGALVASAAADGPVVEKLPALAASAAWLHARAAALAASRLGPLGGPVTALDVAEALPATVGEVLADA